MKINCEIDNTRTLKNGIKITLQVPVKEVPRVMKNIYNFIDNPVNVKILVNSEEQKERMKRLSNEQRSKIFAIIKDIADFTVQDKEYVREQTKQGFLNTTEYKDFSLSNCSKDLDNDYIEYLIRLCFEMDVPLSENPIEGLEDIEGYLRICLGQKKCCVCDRSGEIHHVDTIGIGRDRKTLMIVLIGKYSYVECTTQSIIILGKKTLKVNITYMEL